MAIVGHDMAFQFDEMVLRLADPTREVRVSPNESGVFVWEPDQEHRLVAIELWHGGEAMVEEPRSEMVTPRHVVRIPAIQRVTAA